MTISSASGPDTADTDTDTDTGDSGESGDLGTDGELDLPGCDPLADPIEACGPAMACDPQTLACVPANGAGLVNDGCMNDGECTPGLVCFDMRCRELCGPDIPGEEMCNDDRVCTRASDPLPGLCLEPCTLLEQACSVAFDACNVAISSGGSLVSVCTANPGAGVDGDMCEADGECLPGYLCTAAAQHSLPCSGDAAFCCTPTCDVFEQSCFGLEPICHVLGLADQPGAGFCGP
ncbi:hypothetical protein DB30_05344 [Enhygromyxa salina]|uniref:Uncharacterized protein n=1 Tax=Enhygromyxa salina TaxID=215803 RepID=A0A0C1ZDR0_9BACT|nr:hypothetical protein DB30_05344 [Enhygromyxa salina]